MTLYKIQTILILLLILLAAIVPGCTATPRTEPNLPPAPAQPILPSNSVVRLQTAIISGPSGTISYDNVTFTWGSALSSVDPFTITYSTFLQGYDRDYTPFLPDTTRTFTGLASRDYIFYVKAQDKNGNIEPVPVSRSFTIVGVPPPIVVPLPAPVGTGGIMLIGSDINRIAIGSDGITMYALDSINSRLYRSDSSGIGWLDISSKVSGGAPWVDMAIAPDDPRMVAVATDSGRGVYISGDAGATFNSTGLSSVIGAGRAVRCLTISTDYGNKREMAAGIWSGMAGGGVLINILSNFPSGWFDAGVGGVDVFAIKYSPSFAADGNLLAVVSNAAHTYLYTATRDLNSRTTTWNSSAGYPVELCQPGAGTPGTPLNYADISLPSDYNAASAYSRHIFASWSKNHTSQDVYHIADYQVYRVNAPEPISSIAYYGTGRSGKLLAGAAKCQGGGGCYTVQTYFSANAITAGPGSTIWQPSQKPPTGSRDARVSWSPNGNIAYAGTSGTESAVSHSRDNGRTWNQ